MSGGSTRVHVEETPVVGGPTDCLEASYPALFRELRATFRARGVPAEEASDLAQETIVRTIGHLKRHGATRNDLRPLVHTIARNLSVERVRRAQGHIIPLPQDLDVVDDAPGPSDEVLASEGRAEVRDAVASLAPRHRRVVALWMQGLGPAEIARELGIKRNAADALLHRARRRLASRLAPQSLSGLAALVWLRVKSGAKALSDTLASVQPSSASLAPASAALATMGVATLLFLGHAPQPTQTEVRARPPVVQALDSPRVHPAALRAPNRGTNPPHASSANTLSGTVAVGARGRNVGVGADTGPGEDDEIVAGVIYRREEGNRGMVGPLLDQATRSLCETTDACEEAEGP